MISIIQVDESFPVKRIAAPVEKALGEKIAFPPEVVHVSRAAFSIGRGQWDAEAVIAELERKVPGSVLGIFPHDLYVGAMNFVFGAARMGGGAGVLSYHRLRPGHAFKGDERVVAKTFLERVEKEAVHELGHLLGLHHCRNDRCVMSFSPSLYWVDFKEKKFCRNCSARLRELEESRLRERA